MVQIRAVFAELERSLIKERQAEGIAAAKALGKSIGGRKNRIERDSVDSLLKEGITKTEVARRLKIGIASVYRIEKEIRK
jgi:DNA invertase Pin-like site-specific DNA recombinase